jgi:sorbitol-6-phosphate 2-dehydrogenase
VGTRVQDRVALVTGAGSGIGLAIAKALASEGAKVVACDLQPDGVQTFAESTPGALAVVGDASDKDDVEHSVQSALDAHGRLDILVNNAGVSYITPFLDMDDALWDKTMNVNLRGAYLHCKAALPHMLEQGAGKIVNMSSQSGKLGNSHYAAYCASKFGIIGLTQSLALEFGDQGINVNAVCPGVVFTPLWEAMLPDYAKKRGMQPEEVRPYMESKIPMKRLCDPDEVAKTVLFLASTDSDYMTGQSLNVTGGGLM